MTQYGKHGTFCENFSKVSKLLQTVPIGQNITVIYNGPQTHRGVCLDHLEPFRISFKTFEKIPRNVSMKI